MTGRRVLPCLVGLWAAAAAAQANVQATASIPLDGGVGFARAYIVTGGATTEYAMANAGEAIQVFLVSDATEQVPQLGQFATFAVADNVVVGTQTTTLVVAADVGPACPTVCLDIFFWSPGTGFQLQTTAPTNVPTTGVTAMTIDPTTNPLHIYFFGSPQTLYRQDITLTASSVSVVGVVVGQPISVSGALQGLTVNSAEQLLFASDSSSNIYTYPEDGGAGSLYASPANGFTAALGLFYYPFPLSSFAYAGAPYLLAGGVAAGVEGLLPDATSSFLIGTAEVTTADGGRLTQPTAASTDALANVTLVTEDRVVTENPPNLPWLHLVTGVNLFPDGGAPDGGTPTTPDGGSGPTIPIIAPGPGALPGTTNSCNCSTAGSAPMLLALLLPLLVPRRRRR